MTPLPPPAWCGTCGLPATAAWGAAWQRDRLCCPAHDPLSAPGFTAGALPAGFWYRSLAVWPAVMASTGHLGVALP